MEPCEEYFITHNMGLPTIWAFTGRIKYIKYARNVGIEFEIIYEINYPQANIWECIKQSRDFGWRRLWFPRKIEKRWIHWKDFKYSPKPEITIYNCGE